MRIVPQLMFEGRVDEALDLWRRAFPAMTVIPGTPVEVEIAGQPLRLLDSAIPHGFGLTPSFSLTVTCADESELRALADVLGKGGEVLMPLGAYDFAPCFVWLVDAVGVSWQLIVRP
ncbi:VOC family protein [Paracoccus luteus]|uniref:VOC family protein n=1 Tax=Paracoccus luteus TaxID=2508543 RepID=UPI00106F4D3D|nr:VOC family protein [Paracoccus luteus]